MKNVQIRQGDVFVRSVATVTRTGTPITDHGRVILAYGEVTGHAHEVIAGTIVESRRDVPDDGAVDDFGEPFGASVHVTQRVISDEEPLPAAALFEQPDGRRFLFVDRPCVLTHQEHGPIALAPGSYEVIRQREYSPEAIRNVAD